MKRDKLIVNLGDADPITYGGLFVFQRPDGSAYGVRLEPPDDDQLANARCDWQGRGGKDPEQYHPSLRWEVQEFDIERFALPAEIDETESVQSIIEQLEPREWWLSRVVGCARCCGHNPIEYLVRLCSEDPVQRAYVYQSFAGYDSEVMGNYTRLTRQEVMRRFGNYVRRGGTLDKLRGGRYG